ncbi:hypothetical protein EYF80_029991 [Liparis tanakae]|uniref:Uncharacterized protein n=1 Tax=Liparis tanakae TaxID=230148 RepID=A0A4Z2H1Z6_9TELE|nr:hypothetical protein EYF80_029991 [Liparis tanakae]
MFPSKGAGRCSAPHPVYKKSKVYVVASLLSAPRFNVSVPVAIFGRPAASTEPGRAAQQGRHSPPPKPTLAPLSPADSFLASLAASQMGLT